MIRNEDTEYDQKSLRVITRQSPDWNELAMDCVAFAFARGGLLVLGIEDGADEPPPDQRVSIHLADKVAHQLQIRTHNVSMSTTVELAGNGGEFIAIRIARSNGLPSTTKGQVFERVEDRRVRIEGDDMLRAMNERSTFPWETQLSGIGVSEVDANKVRRFCEAIRASDRVKNSVKEKDDAEIIVHYVMAVEAQMTNLGVLCIGTSLARARIGTAPIIQAIKYDEADRKVRKDVWDDYSLSPMEMISAVWEGCRL